MIKDARSELGAHHRRAVSGGPGARLIVARNGFRDSPGLILGTPLREIDRRFFLGATPAAPPAR